MRLVPEPDEGRREFFRAAGRYALLGVLTIGAAFAARKPNLTGQTCVNQGICRGCGVFASCGLPQALSAKQALNRQAPGTSSR